MEKSTIESVFDSLFKFAVNQELRHKGDTKSGSTDMGLLVLKRIIFENLDDDGNRSFERAYYCRMIRFSGSGEVQQFSEKELMSIPEYTKRRLEDARESDQMRDEMKATEIEIFNAFGIEKKAHVWRKDDNGVVDKTTEYRQTGWASENGIRSIRFVEVGGLNEGKKEFSATSPSQFERIP